MDFKTRLKELRTARGLTQEQLANKLNVSKSTISMYEAGQRTPYLEMIDTLCDLFNVDTDYLLGKTNKTTYIPESDNYKFTTFDEAVDSFLRQNVVMGFNGFDITKLSDEEKVEYANELKKMMEILSHKYKDNK